MNLEVIACDYDRIGTSDPIGRVSLGYNRKGTELKHWREMVENPRRPVIHWHALQVRQTNRCVKLLVVVVAVSIWEISSSPFHKICEIEVGTRGLVATPPFHTNLLVLLFVSLICIFSLFLPAWVFVLRTSVHKQTHTSHWMMLCQSESQLGACCGWLWQNWQLWSYWKGWVWLQQKRYDWLLGFQTNYKKLFWILLKHLKE